MDRTDDIGAALPEPPPPRASPRSAAIGTALARYDDVQCSARSGEETQRGRWSGLFAPQYAALAAVAVVALVSLPRLGTADRVAKAPVVQAAAPGQARDESAVAVVTGEAAPAPSAMTQPEVTEAPSPLPSRSAPPPSIVQMQISPSRPAHLIAPSQANPPIVAAAPPAPAPPPGVIPEAESASPQMARGFTESRNADADAAGAIIVTAQRRRTTAATAGDDRSACTLDDPQQALARCRDQINLSAAGPLGRAAALLADGLSAGWSGDLDDAILKFDQVIDLAPRSALAYLNRALARQRQGDVARAAADFELAVRYGPDDPRTYQFRSRFRRKQGDLRGALRDERRADELSHR